MTHIGRAVVVVNGTCPGRKDDMCSYSMYYKMSVLAG